MLNECKCTSLCDQLPIVRGIIMSFDGWCQLHTGFVPTGYNASVKLLKFFRCIQTSFQRQMNARAHHYVTKCQGAHLRSFDGGYHLHRGTVSTERASYLAVPRWGRRSRRRRRCFFVVVAFLVAIVHIHIHVHVIVIVIVGLRLQTQQTRGNIIHNEIHIDKL